MAKKQLIQNSISAVMQMAFPSALADDSTLRAVFSLEVRDGVALNLWGGGIYQGREFVGSFSGLMGFNHNVIGEKKAAVETLLADLQVALEDYGVPNPADMEAPEEPEPENPAAQEGGE